MWQSNALASLDFVSENWFVDLLLGGTTCVVSLINIELTDVFRTMHHCSVQKIMQNWLRNCEDVNN